MAMKLSSISSLPGVVFAVFLVAACSGTIGNAGTLAPQSPSDESLSPSSESPSSSPASTPSSPGPSASPGDTASPGASPSASSGVSNLTVYFFMDGKLGAVHREVPRTVGVARAAVTELLAGPTSVEASGGSFTTEIPDNVLLLGISVANGTATVDLSKEFGSGGQSNSMFGRLAQLTYTLTQFSNVDRVALRLDGQPAFDQPVSRDDYRSFSPAILVDRPAWGSTVANPVRITGSSNVFEAQFLVEIDTAGGSVLAQEQVHATCGTGCWGTFDITVPYHVTREQPGRIKVYNLSAKDGSVEDVRVYQVTLTPAG
jgi:germination protein M